MKNFKLIKKNVPTELFLKELETYLESNSWDTLRAKKALEQRHTLNIHLRKYFLDAAHPYPSECHADFLVGTTYPFFTRTYSFLERNAEELGGQLSRVMIVTLEPHSQVYAHYDKGSYYAKRNRYHLVLKSKGSEMTCGEEKCIWHKGEMWWFNNKLLHEAFNRSDDSRIHIIFDVLPKKRSLLKRLEDWVLKKYYISQYSN